MDDLVNTVTADETLRSNIYSSEGDDVLADCNQKRQRRRTLNSEQIDDPIQLRATFRPRIFPSGRI